MTYYQSLDTWIYRAGIYGFPYIPTDSYCYAQTPGLTYGEIPYQNPSLSMMFAPRALVSNAPGLAAVRDADLFDATDATFTNDNMWVTTLGNGQVVGYDLMGNPLLISFNILGPRGSMGLPASITVNLDFESFLIANGPTILPAHLLVCTLNGTVNAINRDIDPFNALIVIDDTSRDAIYTSIALAEFAPPFTGPGSGFSRPPRYLTGSERPMPTQDSEIDTSALLRTDGVFRDPDEFPTPSLASGLPYGSLMYLVDFNNSEIVVYDGGYQRMTDYDFVDEDTGNPIPANYSPYRINIINNLAYVCYVKRNPNSAYPQSGGGYINVFDLLGNYVRRFASMCNLDAPVSCILAPSWYRYPAGAILVANNGTGIITVFSESGKCLGTLDTPETNPILIPGIRSLATNLLDPTTVYWVARDSASSSSSPTIVGTINGRRDIEMA